MAESGSRDGDSRPGTLRPADASVSIAIIDFLMNAESVVRRLGEHTNVADWLLIRRLEDEWIVLASHGSERYRPGDVLDRPAAAASRLSALADRWEEQIVVDLTSGHLEPGTDGASVERTGECGLVAYPLWAGQGLFGAVCALPCTPEEMESVQQAAPMVRITVELLASVLGLDLDRSRLQRRLDAAESAALSDPLTGLGNRRAFDRALDREEARCARFGHQAGVVILDLDGLKRTNDTAGHEAGDELLRRAAATITRTLRSADQAFRFGGDEFALLLPEVSSEGIGALRDRLLAALAEAGVSASIGCAVRRPGGGDLHTCARAADAAMYANKRERAASNRSARSWH